MMSEDSTAAAGTAAAGPYGRVTDDGALRFERVLPGPMERVWTYLTDADKRALWLAGGPMDLEGGGRVELRFNHAELSPEDEPTPERHREMEDGHTSRGTITRVAPPRLLSFTWAEDADEDSEVTFELSPRGDGDVLLVLTHRRLADGEMVLSVASGWHTHLGILADRLSDRDPRPFWSTHAEMEAAYAERLDADTLAP